MIIAKVIKPSRPSIKLIIFIIEVPINIKKIVYEIIRIFDKSILIKRDKINIEVITLNPYLIFDLSPTLSSIIPLMTKGKDNNGMKYPIKLEQIYLIKEENTFSYQLY